MTVGDSVHTVEDLVHELWQRITVIQCCSTASSISINLYPKQAVEFTQHVANIS